MAIISELIDQIEDKALRDRLYAEFDKMAKQKKFGLVFEEHLPECTPLWDIPVKRGSKVALKAGQVSEFYTVLKIENGVATCLNKDRSATAEFAVDELVSVAEFGEPIYPYLKPLDTVCNAPDSDLWHTLIEADNYHALQLLEYLYAGKVDCIYIDPPYNTGARDWKYNNDYVDNSDQYRHSKWLSMIQKRLRIAKRLLNPKNSVLIVTIDDVEIHTLGLLIQELFPDSYVQTITSVINPSGKTGNGFSVVHEYIVVAFIGEAQLFPSDEDMLLTSKDSDSISSEDLAWESLLRRGSSWTPSARPNLFYPVLIDKSTERIVGVGNPTPESPNLPTEINGHFAAWPKKKDGSYSIWRVDAKKLMQLSEKGYAHAAGYDPKRDTYAFRYLMKGDLDRIASGEIKVERKGDYGEVVAINSYTRKKTPKSVWNVSSHNAGMQGSDLLSSIIGRRGFSFPKSLYAVHDTIRFFVKEKPNALIVDFFAGSGTTLHAVNLLNAEDGGHRRCILVTNNEVSAAEAKEMSAKGFKPGDEEWEKLGIARYVTWPRTVCSIEGHDINGKPLKGNYIGSDIPMADGFKANAAYFKLGFLDRNAVALGRQFKEMLPTLWMKAGAHGPCPMIGEDTMDMLILPENKFAVLVDEKEYMAFAEKLDEHPEIETVFIITDSESGYRDMIAGLNVKESYQLYRDYLDNFRINAARR